MFDECVMPSIITPDDVSDFVYAGADDTPHDYPAETLAEYIEKGQVVVLSKELLEHPEIRSVIAEHLRLCLERQRQK